MEHSVFSYSKKSQLAFSVTGAVIGLMMIILSVQIYVDITTVLSAPSIIGKDFLVLSKEVSMLSDGNFSEDEIVELKSQEFILDVAPVEGNRFESFVVADMGTNARFNTLMPLISIPDNFIDNLSDDFSWTPGQTELPVIIPTSFFNSYNFGIAEASKSPKVTKELMATIRPKLRIGKTEWYNIRIVAFSDRFSDGVIVPDSFLNYGNEYFASIENKKMNRIVISALNIKSPLLQEFIESHAYVANQDKLKGGKITEFMNVLLPVVLSIAAVIVLLSLLTFIQNAQLMLAGSDYEVGLLGFLGYAPLSVSKLVMKKFNRLFLLILILALPLCFILKWFINGQFEYNLGINMGLSISWATILTGSAVYFIFYVAQFYMIRIAVKKKITAS